MSTMPTTQQRRAKHAWDTVQAARDQGLEFAEFSNQVIRLGPRIVTAGLGPAIAFLAEKEKSGDWLRRSLGHWLLEPRKIQSAAQPKSTQNAVIKAARTADNVPPDLQQRIREGSSDDLRRWTAESLEWLVWVKRFCQADANTATGTKP